jgi:hypothetical protein
VAPLGFHPKPRPTPSRKPAAVQPTPRLPSRRVASPRTARRKAERGGADGRFAPGPAATTRPPPPTPSAGGEVREGEWVGVPAPPERRERNLGAPDGSLPPPGFARQHFGVWAAVTESGTIMP